MTTTDPYAHLDAPKPRTPILPTVLALAAIATSLACGLMLMDMRTRLSRIESVAMSQPADVAQATPQAQPQMTEAEMKLSYYRNNGYIASMDIPNRKLIVVKSAWMNSNANTRRDLIQTVMANWQGTPEFVIANDTGGPVGQVRHGRIEFR